MARRYYLDLPDAQFDLWLNNFVSFVQTKITMVGSTPPEWPFIDADDFEEVKNAQTDWKTHFTAFLASPTTSNRTGKDEAKARTKKVVGPFVQGNLYHKKITNAERISAGVPVRDIVRSVHIIVTELVDFFFRLKGIREIEVHFKVAGSDSKARPTGYTGAVIVWDVLDSPPARPQELKRHALATKSPHVLAFDESERGRVCYVAMCWENGRAIQGGWTEIYSAIVP